MATAQSANQFLERYLSFYAATHPESFRRYIRNLTLELTAKRAQAVQVASVRRAKARKAVVITVHHPFTFTHPRVAHRAPIAAGSRSSGGGDGPGDGPADPVAALLSTFAQEVR